MAHVELVAAHPRHIASIASRMRDVDKIETAALGHTPKQALRAGLSQSLWALTALVDGKPEAMLGVVAESMVESAGTPWLLGTDAVYERGRDMLVKGRDVVALMLNTFSRLGNLVSADNDAAIRLLRRWGFSVEGGPVHIGGVSFLHFGMTR